MSNRKGAGARRKASRARKETRAQTAAPAGPLRLRATAITHQGHVRSNNEDCLGVCEWVRRTPMHSPISFECLLDEPRLCVVADGLGGHPGGETASLMAVLALSQSSSALQSEQHVASALREVNKLMYETMETRPDLVAMGSTAVGIVVSGAQVWLFNVGDSRGYGRKGGHLCLLSTDDTDVRSPASDRTGLIQHCVTQCLGGQPYFEEIEPHVVACPVAAGDRYLLCSDGLTDMLDLAAIERCLSADAHASVEKLLTAALAEGGRDNISIILADIFAPEARDLK